VITGPPTLTIGAAGFESEFLGFAVIGQAGPARIE
jgi:hypothetical protein